MRYIIREKFFRLGEDSTIMNEAGQPVFEVDGKVLSLHDRLIVRDLAGNETVAETDKPILIDLVEPKFEILGVKSASPTLSTWK
jgi:uncharacterized protein YxjI